MRVDFYHLQKHPLEKVLPKLCEKIFSSGKKAIILAGSNEKVEAINSLLWSYDETSWLPHGSKKNGHAEKQPIWICKDEERPNSAEFVVLTDSSESENLEAYERCLDIFDGNDTQALQKARERWKKTKEAGHQMFYWQQTDTGSWAQKAAANCEDR